MGGLWGLKDYLIGTTSQIWGVEGIRPMESSWVETTIGWIKSGESTRFERSLGWTKSRKSSGGTAISKNERRRKLSKSRRKFRRLIRNIWLRRKNRMRRSRRRIDIDILGNPRLERENRFLKNNISRQETRLSSKIIQFISLNTLWITKKDAGLCSRVKLSSVSS